MTEPRRLSLARTFDAAVLSLVVGASSSEARCSTPGRPSSGASTSLSRGLTSAVLARFDRTASAGKLAESDLEAVRTQVLLAMVAGFMVVLGGLALRRRGRVRRGIMESSGDGPA